MTRPRPSLPLVALTCLIGLASAAIGIGVARNGFADGEDAGAWFGVMLAVLGVLLVAGPINLMQQRRLPAGGPVPTLVQVEGETATVLPRWPVPTWSAAMLSLGLAVGPVAWTVLAARSGSWLGAALLAVPAGYFLSLPIFVLTGRFVAGGLWVTPTRIVSRSASVSLSVAWDDLVAMHPGPGGQFLTLSASRFEQRFTTPWFRGKVYRRRPVPCVAVEFLPSDPVETRMFLETYLREPALRAELGTEASLVRLTSLLRQAADARSRSGEHGAGS